MDKLTHNEWFKTIVISLLLVLLCKFTFLIYIVDGESMYPTLEDRNLGIALRTTIKDIEREDIVVIKLDNRYLIKRVVGLPGENIKYKDNKLYINNKEYNDKFSYITDDYSIDVGKNEYFCLGDNRQYSADSRTFGCFNKKNVKAVAIGKK